MPQFHTPVLTEQITALLQPKRGGVYLDATLGGGGHAVLLAERIGRDGVLIGIDRDPEAVEYAREKLKECPCRLILVEGNFRDVHSILDDAGIGRIDGAIADLGVSSHQLDSLRGFSFSDDQDLDMRMSPSQDILNAADVVNTYSEARLAEVIRNYGEERYARRIAKAIVKRRGIEPITRTRDLADIIVSAVPGRSRRGQEIHPATRTFQAIRIEVNGELGAIEAGIPAMVERLKVGGRICVVSFHSLEDRIVKRTLRRLAGYCECPPGLPECRCGVKRILKVITRKPVVPDAEEIASNPRCRSAKLRCAQRIAE